ncbi:beta-lactamase/transpeptidase-like protein [Mycena rebaudengoi]|nr:beta-lactamase/transpeptidase-like protein [Mycena rebaudengoi]
MASLSASKRDALDLILAEAVKNKIVPHLFVGVTNVESEIYMQQVGTKIVDDHSSGFVDEDSTYMLWSQTKFITAIAAMHLIEQGKITLDTPVDEILPELANPVVATEYGADGKPSATTPAKSKITFGQLLNHSSGLDYSLSSHPLDSGLCFSYTTIYKDNRGGVSEFFKLNKGSLPGQPLRFEPGTGFAYGFGNDCAGFVIERLSGKTLEEYFQQYIFALLGIKSMSFYPTPNIKERLLPLTFRKADDRSLEPFNDRFTVLPRDPADIKVHLGGVGLFGSLKDYLTILRHVLQIKVGKAVNPILSTASVEEFFKPSLSEGGVTMLGQMVPYLAKGLDMPAGAQQYSHGLLLNTVDVPGKRRKDSAACESGWANTSFFIDPASGIAFVLGTQLVSPADDEYEKLYNEVERALYAGLSPQ